MFAFIYMRDLFRPYWNMALLVSAALAIKGQAASDLNTCALALLIMYISVMCLMATADVIIVTMYARRHGGVRQGPSRDAIVWLETINATRYVLNP